MLPGVTCSRAAQRLRRNCQLFLGFALITLDMNLDVLQAARMLDVPAEGSYDADFLSTVGLLHATLR